MDRLFILALLASAPAAQAADCAWAASDNTGRVWAHRDQCSTSQSGSTTEIIVGARDTLWSVAGGVGRQIIPNLIWTKEGGWTRDRSRDQVIWEGSVAPTDKACHIDGRGGGGWEFSNGLRICTGGR
ncbi:hypothetical protein UFOVP32_28 [uncultured Caudovirales phage]|uniref:Uncharacterized protein n=1 Tax=uncultured Caudovirales phage TaxID=2100421 RepID=A0A6J5KQY1_9CAUD|nr:hypothetical protein UFOVP32_28 [uncultured Caudovirales phage]CAB4123716.1 hypothetical protein UFOVP50_48 [uncultured Caudovirales phage]